jgi:hypothetical protein
MKILIFWLDALGYRFISEKETPFLYSLKKQYSYGKHQQVFGYTSIGAAFQTGEEPRVTGQLFQFQKGSSWKGKVVSFFPNKFIDPVYNLFRILSGNTSLIRVPDKRLLRNFCLSYNNYYNNNSLPVRTVLNLLDKKGLKYIDYNWPYLVRNGKLRYDLWHGKRDEEIVNRFLRLVREDDYRVLFLHIYELDELGHKYGPDSVKFKLHLKKMDNLVRRLFERLMGERDLFLVWSDHGMVSVRKSIDVKKFLPARDDYLYILDSTTARFWFESESVKIHVMSELQKLKQGRWMTEKEKGRWLNDELKKKFGEEMFVCKPGYMLIPNIYQKKQIKGMHGYGGFNEVEWGIYITNLLKKNSESILQTTELHRYLKKAVGSL